MNFSWHYLFVWVHCRLSLSISVVSDRKRAISFHPHLTVLIIMNLVIHWFPVMCWWYRVMVLIAYTSTMMMIMHLIHPAMMMSTIMIGIGSQVSSMGRVGIKNCYRCQRSYIWSTNSTVGWIISLMLSWICVRVMHGKYHSAKSWCTVSFCNYSADRVGIL